eukprot:CAMPEP_0201210904 /NCGR_PEP_ID=MMETSP0851-20130426/181237_1 /ASSEMBLY_ACC=CAM_ASM_000631 /TAXON_ID=183588 /ORGANISM="Pseudo-nitzschia fraudulenta, Strain WWA7" /LENGTH=417 /DNA_ID=CAMNT_0047499765 /DNA_START=39 /DNA_END=1292 /DNA_ORIENTATION=+
MRCSTIIINAIALANLLNGVSSSSVAAPVAAAPVVDGAKSDGGGGNVVFQLVGYVKDSLVRTVDGTKEMWASHGRCKQIRSKQKEYRDKLQKQWEFEEKGLTPKEMKKRLTKVNGGISYDEFIFLVKGKEDRGKLMNMMFLMWGAPRFFPYALMFYPEILPGPFAPLPDASGKESKLQKLSRERTHAVIRTMLAIETEARSVPGLAKLNIFGKKKQARRMDEMDSLGKTIGSIMTAPGAESDANGALFAMNTMEHLLYRKDPITRKEERFVNVPKSLTNGIMAAIDGPKAFQSFMPHFMKRGQLLTHVQKVNEIDNFLVDERVNLDDLSTARLLEACSDRMIGGPGQSDDEMRNHLNNWLDLGVDQPAKRCEETGEHFNSNLAKMTLMGFYCISGARDDRSASYLSRYMYSSQSRIK